MGARPIDGRLKPPEPDDVDFMMSKDAYINDSAGAWHPHVMFLTQRAKDSEWGANLPGSPLQADSTNVEQTSLFMVLVANWSDGTLAAAHKQ